MSKETYSIDQLDEILFRIIKGVGGFYYAVPVRNVELTDSDGNPIPYPIECKAKGKFRLKKIKPAIGDLVRLIVSPEGDFSIEEIEPRKNELIRPTVVNVDKAILCFALTKPKPDLTLLDKLLVYCQMSGVDPIILFTKADTDKKDNFSYYKKIYEPTGFPVLEVSAKEDENFDALTKLIQGETAFLAGPSGVGKSTLINRLSSHEMDTGQLSDKTGRGKHTTRHVELLPSLSGGFLVDTPGFSNLEFEMLDPDFSEYDLPHYYPEFEEESCRFDDCAHIKEPGCGVREAVREGRIAKERYLNYKELRSLIQNRKKY